MIYINAIRYYRQEAGKPPSRATIAPSGWQARPASASPPARPPRKSWSNASSPAWKNSGPPKRPRWMVCRRRSVFRCRRAC